MPRLLTYLRYVTRDPGTDQVRSFENHTTISDQQSGGILQRIVSMTHPAKHLGYPFCQTSYNESDGKCFSVVGVPRAPETQPASGRLPVVFAGYIVMMVGMLGLLVRRVPIQHATALDG